MNKTVITAANIAIESELPFIETYGLTRVAEKKDGSDLKKYPATVNLYEENCNTDKEVYILPNRGKQALLWWEIRDSKVEKVFKNVNLLQANLRMFVWMNTAKINQDGGNDYISEIIAALPEEINSGAVIKAAFQDISYDTSADNFKKYSFDKQFEKKPYEMFSIDMKAIIYYTCLKPLIIKTYNECGILIS